MDGAGATRGATVALAAIGLAALLCVLLSLDRGLELADESSYIYLLHHPDVVMQFLDHRLWSALRGSVPFYRALAMVLTTISACFVAAGAIRALRVERSEALFVQAATVVGALGYFSVIRPTMNYGTTGLFFGNLFVGLLLHDLAQPAERRVGLVLTVLLGVSLALLGLGRFTAVPVYLLILLGYAVLRDGPAQDRLMLFAGALLTSGIAVMGLRLAGFRIEEMVAFGSRLTGVSHRPITFVPRDLALIALMGGVGVGGAVAARLGARIGVPRSSAIGLFVAAVLLAAIADQRAVILAPAVGASPFVTNVALYGTTYAFYVVAALFVALLALDDLDAGRADWVRHARTWGVLILLALACGCPFFGTNTGVLARSGLNAGPLFAGIALAALACSERQLVSRSVALVSVIGVAALGTLFVFLNSIWSAYGVNGGWVRQTERLQTPVAVAGLRVSPGTAALARDLRAGLTRLAFDPARDRLLVGYEKPGLALLAGGEIAGLPFVGDDLRASAVLCDEITRSVTAARPRRLYGLNIDYRPELSGCLAANGIDLVRALRHRVSPLVTITVVTPIPR